MFHFIFLAILMISTHAWSFGGEREPERSPGSDLSAEDRNWREILLKHGGSHRNPSSYSNNVNGFNSYLKDSGVSAYDAFDIVTPNNRGAANRCGYEWLLPPQSDWLKGAALAKWTEAAGRVSGSFPRVRNWYRPSCYNSAVGGASGSDHIQARAFDLDWSSTSGRRRAQDWLCQFWNSPQNMQVGLGSVSVHLGAESPRGKRNWYYSSYRDSDRNNTCFDR